MKTLLGLLSIAFAFAFELAVAGHLDGVEAYLDFDPNYAPKNELIESQYLKVVPENTQYRILSEQQERKFEVALSLLEEVLNSEEFKLKVLAYRRRDGKRLFQKNYLWHNADARLSNEDVYNILMAGDEKMIPGTLGEMNIYSWIKKCRWYDLANPMRNVWCRKVVGSTSPSESKWIKHNYKFYKRYAAPEMVNNIVHEWIHLLGFLHGPKATMGEEAPYVLGRIAQSVAESILARQL